MMSSIASRGSERPAAMVSIPTGPPPKLPAIIVEVAAVELIEAKRVDFEAQQSLVGNLAGDMLDAGDRGEIANPPQQPPGDARRAARPSRDLQRAVVAKRHAEDAGAAPDDLFQLLDGVEVEAHRNAETVAQRVGQQAEPRRRRDQRELGKVDLDRAGSGAFADDQVELVVLHRRVENFLDGRVQPVDLVDEQHIAVFEIGQQGRQIAGLGDDRPGGGPEVDAEFARHDLRQRRLAETRGADEQHVIEGFAAALGSLDEHLEVRPRRGLADEIVKRLRAQRDFRVFAAGFGRDKAGREAHRPVFACDE